MSRAIPVAVPIIAKPSKRQDGVLPLVVGKRRIDDLRLIEDVRTTPNI